MKKLLILFVAVFIAAVSLAQTSGTAQQSYQKFNSLLAANSAESELYNALDKCYKDNFAALDTYAQGSSQHQAAKSVLVTIWPYLRNAALYYEHKDDRKSVHFAQAYVDIPTSQYFQGEYLEKDSYYHMFVYKAAYLPYTNRNYTHAVKYFKEYLDIGAEDYREMVLVLLAQSYYHLNDYEQVKSLISDPVAKAVSTDKYLNLLSMAINACIATEDDRMMQRFLSEALNIQPDQMELLNIQSNLYEKNGNYEAALKTYQKLFSKNPTSLSIAKGVARSNYNLGVTYVHKATLESDRRIAGQYDNHAIRYFESAIPVLKDVLRAEPSSLAYHKALAVSYQMTGKKNELTTQNQKISSMGGRAVTIDDVPSLMAAAPSNNTMSSSVNVASHNVQSGEIPLYSQYAKTFVEENIHKWQAKDPYETNDEYKSRVNQKTREAKVQSLLKEAEAEYIKMYTRDLKISDFNLCPYDAENEVFLAESAYGEILIPVPRAKNEARIFESTWNGVQCHNPRYAVDNDKIVLQALTFVTPMGNSYRYDNNGAMTYTQTEVDIQFADIDYSSLGSSKSSKPKHQIKKEKVTVGVSDVDKNIPVSKVVNDKTFAVIIANENYNVVSDVPMALNDGTIFKEYCMKTLGLPENNVRFYEDATSGTMLRAISDIQTIAQAYKGDLNVIFYYAGHGFPDEHTKDAYLLPVDGDGTHIDIGYSLARLYSELSEMEARSVCVFLDACFSGAQRDGDMLASARGVALKPQPAAPRGNMIVFSAASDDETALPYEDKGHGLFTYYLLKKLQESKGTATMEEISRYVIDEVSKKSIVVNHKSQTPQIVPSASLSSSWKSMKLKP